MSSLDKMDERLKAILEATKRLSKEPMFKEASDQKMIQFLKFTKTEHDGVMWHTMVSARIELPEKNFREVEKALKPLGISFRKPSGR